MKNRTLQSTLWFAILMLSTYSTCFCQKVSQKRFIRNEIAKAINMIQEEEKYHDVKRKLHDSAQTIIYSFKNKSLEHLISLWNPSMKEVKMRFVLDMIFSKVVLDSTIYKKIYERNLNTTDPRMAYLNAAMLFVARNGAMMVTEIPPKNWGECPLGFLELILSKIDDTNTITVSINNRPDFMRGVVDIAKKEVALKCKDKKNLGEFKSCVDKLLPKDSIKVSIGELNKVCFLELTIRAIAEFLETKVDDEEFKTTVISSDILRDWYSTNKNKIVWGRKERCFIPLAKTNKKSK